MARNDPTETGGLFIGRRPGTAPVKYRDTPQRLGSRRQRIDGLLAYAVLVLEILIAASCWIAQPLALLWFGGQVNYWTDSVFVGVVAAFLGLLASVMATLWVAVRLDGLWRILRRAAGHDQREGVLPRIFGWTAVIAGGGFLIWLIFVNGPGSLAVPQQS
jgi:hypothetical protein